MNTLSQTTLPSIRNRSLLVSLSFGKPPMTKLDRKATHDAEQANNAHGALKTQKMLYPKALIDPITSKENEIRAYLRSRTIEWGRTGMYLLDTANFMEVADRLSKYEVERKQLVTVFAQNWSTVLSQAALQQGALFDPSAYPDVSDVVSNFTMHVAYLPVGDIGNGLFDNVEKEIKDAITAEVEKATKEILNDAIKQPYERLLDAVLNIYDKTSRDDSRIHESLIESLDEITSLMPALNVTNDPRLAQLAAECNDKLSVHPDVLKEKDSDTRKRVAESAKEILVRMGADPVAAQKLKAPERKAMAQDIASKMKGFF